MSVGSRIAALGVACLFVVGCASLQLNHNISELASTSVDLITSQVLTNLVSFRENEFAIPSQVAIPSGSATTTNSITPTVGGPLGVSATTTLANTAAAPFFNATTHTRVKPNGTFGVTAADQWSQNYSMTPLQDPGQLLRLRALYRFGAGQTNKRQFLCEYPLVQRAQGSGAGTTVNVSFGPERASTAPAAKPPIKYILRYEHGPINCEGYEYWSAGTPDPALLKLPTCVVCDLHADDAEDNSVKFQGSTTENDATISNVQDPSTNDMPAKLKIGDIITGKCIQPSAVSAIDYGNNTIRIDHPAKNSTASCDFTTRAKSLTHVLFLNPSLSNDWIVFGPLPPGQFLEGGVNWLGTYGGTDVYLKADFVSQKRFSDFVIIVLEATQMGGSSSGSSSTTQRVQTPAAAQIELN